MARTTRTALAAVLSAALVTACGGGEEKEEGPAETSSTSSASATSGSSSSELDRAAEESGIDPSKPPKPVASVTMPGNNITDDQRASEITIDLLGLRRQGDLLVLNIGFTPDEGKATSYYGWTTTRWAPQIVDTTNLKVHDVVTSAEGTLSTDTGPGGIRVSGGQTLHLHAVFAAPPADVEKVTVKAADGAPAFTGVKIQ